MSERSEFILVVTGGRDHVQKSGRLFANEEAQFVALIDELQPTIFREGEARGVDVAARDVVRRIGRKIQIQKWPAEWERYGNAAGPIRNGAMLRGTSTKSGETGGLAHHLAAFPGGTGTDNCVRQAEKLLVRVTFIDGMPKPEIKPTLAVDKITVEAYREVVQQRFRLTSRGNYAAAVELDPKIGQMWSALTDSDRDYVSHWLRYLRPDQLRTSP